MSPADEHGARWDDDVAAYALDALDERESRMVADHLAECDRCAERLRWYAPAVNVLPAAVPTEEPPPALRARLMEIVEREGAVEQAPAAAPPARRSLADRLGLSGFPLRPAMAGLAAFLLLAAGVLGYALRDGSDSGPQVYAAVGQGQGSLAKGTLRVDGDSGMLEVHGLPEAKRDEVYQAWVEERPEAGGEVHPSSVFVVSDQGVGDVAIPTGLEDAQRVMVTREPRGGSETPHESSLITAEIE